MDENVRRVASIPVEYVAALAVAVFLGVGIYVLRQSQTSSTASRAAPLLRYANGESIAAPGTVFSPPSDLSGLTLLRRAQRAYARIPAVEITATVEDTSVRLTDILQADEAVAEEGLVQSRRTGTTTLVAPAGLPTFERAPGTSCWRTLARTSPQALDDVGQHFPPSPASQSAVQSPRRTRDGWLVGVGASGQIATYEIDAKTYLVRTIDAGAGSAHVSEDVHAVGAPPKLAVPEPRC